MISRWTLKHSFWFRFYISTAFTSYTSHWHFICFHVCWLLSSCSKCSTSVSTYSIQSDHSTDSIASTSTLLDRFDMLAVQLISTAFSSPAWLILQTLSVIQLLLKNNNSSPTTCASCCVLKWNHAFSRSFNTIYLPNEINVYHCYCRQNVQADVKWSLFY